MTPRILVTIAGLYAILSSFGWHRLAIFLKEKNPKLYNLLFWLQLGNVILFTLFIWFAY